MRSRAFTLIELLVVIAIIAILSIVVVLTLNPAQLLQSGRDSNRVSDMATLNSALSIFGAEGGTGLGSSNVIYISIPDPTATSTAGDQCQGLSLISLPATYSYHCAASSTFRNVNGTGWIPVNFNSLTAGAPLGSLPIDPTNTSSSRLYYTYDTNGSQYEVTSVMESSKYQIGGSNDAISNDGGTLASVYEKGSVYGLEPLDYGDNSLVGYWPLNEGSGSIAYDDSGNSAIGSWLGTQVGTNGYYSLGKIGPYAGAFDGTTDYINVTSSPSFSFGGNAPFTVAVWINGSTFTLSGNFPTAITKGDSGNCYETYGFYVNTLGELYFETNPGGGCGNDKVLGISPDLATSSWYQAVGVYDGTSMLSYVNGVLKGTLNISSAPPLVNSSSLWIGRGYTNSNIQDWVGLLDDVRIYNRALSASQIAALYAGGK